MTFKRYFYSWVWLILLIAACKPEQPSVKLPRSTPESEGVSSEGILSFLNAIDTSKHEFHSFIFLRHGKVIVEGWWDPYGPELKHTLYSTSKSFTSTAVGFAVSEKKLSVDDKVVSFFPEILPDTVSPFLEEMKVKDLLTMTAGQAPDPTGLVVSKDSNWAKGFLALPIVDEPGTKFLYNSLATYMLSAIVQKITGQKIIDYLTPRLFEPLVITGIDWEVDPRGINTGGWGLRLKTEDMAKFGQLYLQKGNWQGRQVLPAEWIEEATTAKIDQAPDAPQARKDSSDWMQGYCYQFWRCRHNAFRADGAFGQFIIIMPDQDAVVAITAETSDMQSELNLVWEYLLPAIQDEELPANETIKAALNQKLASLALPVPAREPNPQVVKDISGKTYTLQPNEKKIKSMFFHFMEDMCHLTLKTDDDVAYNLTFGAGNWQTGETARPGPYLVSGAKAALTGLPPFKVAGCYTWKDDHTLELTLRYIESPHTERITCHFDQKDITVNFISSFNPLARGPEIRGSM
jgi:CubicO group peptidase (beta-lactamase class C family)